MKALLSPVLLALILAGGPLACAGSDEPELDSAAEGTEAVTASATPVFATTGDDVASAVAVRNGMTLTMHSTLAWHTGASGEELVLRGSTSQEITSVYGFIPDDGFGTSTQLGPKSFELVFDNASDINTVISGNPFYLKLTTHTATGDHDWSAQLYATPRLVPPSGSTTTRLALGPAIAPTYVTYNPDGVVFRGTVTTTVRPQSMTITSDSTPNVTQDSPHAWHFDWDFSGFESAATGGQVQAAAKFGATTSKRSGTVEIRLSQIGLAAGDSPDDIYGFPECDPDVLECLKGLPASTTDFGACGTFFPVGVCIDNNGFPVQ